MIMNSDESGMVGSLKVIFSKPFRTTVGRFSLRADRRNEFVDDIRKGKVFVLTVYKQPWGVAFHYFPERVRDEFPGLFKRENAEPRRASALSALRDRS